MKSALFAVLVEMVFKSQRQFKKKKKKKRKKLLAMKKESRKEQSCVAVVISVSHCLSVHNERTKDLVSLPSV